MKLWYTLLTRLDPGKYYYRFVPLHHLSTITTSQPPPLKSENDEDSLPTVIIDVFTFLGTRNCSVVNIYKIYPPLGDCGWDLEDGDYTGVVVAEIVV